MGDTRERILEASAELFRRQGYVGTGMNQIVAEAQAALGSIYHFFPGGKQQLGAEAIRRSGELYDALIDTVFDAAPDVVAGVGDFFRGAAEHLEVTGFADACPIATVALEVASTDETLRRATADVFERWTANAAARFRRAGMPPARAQRVATLLLALLEGSFVLCRAARSTEALRVAEHEAVALVITALRLAADDAPLPTGSPR